MAGAHARCDVNEYAQWHDHSGKQGVCVQGPKVLNAGKNGTHTYFPNYVGG